MNTLQKHTDYNNNFFKRIVDRYDVIVLPLKGLRKKVLNVSQANPQSKIIDLACGTGEQSVVFARAGHSVIGIDLSKDMLDKARKKLHPNLDLTFQHCSATELPYDDGVFDMATISLALHDMPVEMALSVLREMKRVTKKGGSILIMEHHVPSNLFGSFMHWFFTHFDTEYYPLFIDKGLKSYLEEVGLEFDSYSTCLLGLFQIARSTNK